MRAIFRDTNLPLSGADSIVGRSIVVHAPSAANPTCVYGNIVGGSLLEATRLLSARRTPLTTGRHLMAASDSVSVRPLNDASICRRATGNSAAYGTAAQVGAAEEVVRYLHRFFSYISPTTCLLDTTVLLCALLLPPPSLTGMRVQRPCVSLCERQKSSCAVALTREMSPELVIYRDFSVRPAWTARSVTDLWWRVAHNFDESRNTNVSAYTPEFLLNATKILSLNCSASISELGTLAAARCAVKPGPG